LRHDLFERENLPPKGATSPTLGMPGAFGSNGLDFED